MTMTGSPPLPLGIPAWSRRKPRRAPERPYPHPHARPLPLLAATVIAAAALSAFTKTGLTDIADIVPWIRFLVTDGWWMTGQTILVNGGYTTK